MTALAVATALLVAFVVTRASIEPLRRRGAVDVPNERSSHRRPTPRGGGLGVLAGLLAGGGVAAATAPGGVEPILAVALILVAAAGLADDLSDGVSRWARLAIQTAAALLVVLRLGGLDRLPLPAPADLPLGPAGAVVGVVWIVGLVNLTNFLDGIDGLAATQGLLAGVGFAVAGLARSQQDLATLGLLLAASCLGFLPFNRDPARVFLGDVGSSTIGFAMAAAPWTLGVADRPRGALLAGLLASYFLADGTLTLAGRLARGEAFWRPHRLHLYQRLVATGLGHGETVARTLGPALPPAALAVAGYAAASAVLEWVALAAALVALGVVHRQVRSREGLAARGAGSPE
jgi:UDP-N-acetylmuramyl pentapeptide phosphotransferase/UDP-N-acetylglucosamine-1-phosphate transferase